MDEQWWSVIRGDLCYCSSKHFSVLIVVSLHPPMWLTGDSKLILFSHIVTHAFVRGVGLICAKFVVSLVCKLGCCTIAHQEREPRAGPLGR